MIKLFQTLDKIYTSNGDVVLNPTKAVVHKEDNGSFYLNLETGLDEKEYKSEEIEGQTIEGTNFNIDVDLSKEYSFDSFKGNTTQEGTPTPDAPIPVNVVSGDNTINIVGKNLFDNSIITNKTLNGLTITNDNGLIKIVGTATSGTNLYYNIDNSILGLQVGETYTLSVSGTLTGIGNFGFKKSGADRLLVVECRRGATSKTSTITESVLDFNRFDFWIPSGSVVNASLYIQLEKGNQATTYEPYQSQSYEINLGDIELCKIGDYQDRIYKNNGKWYLEKQIGKVVLDGSETGWHTSSLSVTGYKSYYVDSSVRIYPYTSGNKCNYFEFKTYDEWIGLLEATFIEVTAQAIGIRVLETLAPTLEDFKTWLSTHNTIVYYVLVTPTTTEITDTSLINQLESIELIEGTNNISSNGNLPIIMNLHYNYRNAYSNVVKYNDYLTSGHIIVANTPQGEQAFRITNVEKTRSKIKIKANHVFYDSVNYLIEDSYVVDKNCNDALDHLNLATSDLSPFTTISNVTNIASYRCVRKSLYEAIQVVLERWGGHLVRDNWTIGIYDSIGQDNGVTIRYAKNLKNITATYNWDDVVTKLMPVGKDEILLNAIDPSVSVYVEALNPYVVPFTKTISFSQDNIEEDNYRDEDGNLDEGAYKQALVEDLYAQATHYVEEHQVPSVNYSLSANVEKISDIGDTIQVTDERLGIDLLTHVISYDYDCILQQYKQLEFGNFTPQLSNLVTTIERKTDEVIRESTATIQVTLNNELQQATSQIWSALSDSYVIYEGDKILIVDTLPKEDATNVIMINNGGIGFSNTGINGQFNSAWTIDNVLNMEQINVINLTADMIKGGTLKLGSNLNQNGRIEVFDESNTLIAELNKDGLKMYGVDGSYVLMNNEVGFAGYDRNDNKIYWVAQDEFHMKKSVVEEEITLCNKLRFIPIEIYNGSTLVNDGIGLVSVAGGGN